MRISLIHHPDAGDDDQPDGEALSRLLRSHNHAVRYQSADEPAWAAVLDEPADLVVVAGGDGTVGRVAKKLIGRELPLAPLPLGTANNISKTLGLLEHTLDEIVEGWKHAETVRFDAGVAKGPWGSRYFLEAVGIGLFAFTIPAADRSKKLKSMDDADEKIAHAVGMLRERLHRYPAQRLDMIIDGKPMSDDYVLFEAMNMEFVGPNLYLAPDIDPDDGLFDIVLVTEAERDALEEPLANWQAGNLHPPRLTRIRASTANIEWTGFEVHIDDEAWPPKQSQDRPQRATIELSVERDALDFLAPPRVKGPRA